MAVIYLDNRKQFNESIEETIKKLRVATTNTVRELGKIAVEVAQNTNSFRNTLKESTHFTQNGYEGIVQDDREYAFYLEYGNNQLGDRIYPTKAKALHFIMNGQEIFAKSVKAHSGYYFVTNGRDIAESSIEAVFAGEFNAT